MGAARSGREPYCAMAMEVQTRLEYGHGVLDPPRSVIVDFCFLHARMHS